MFNLNKLTTLFFKKTFISFYKENQVFYINKQIIQNNKILSNDNLSFEKEEEFLKFISDSSIENTQTYISTLIDNFNQGIIDSCSQHKYKELGINIDNIKILCLKDYSIFIGLYELNSFKKEIEKYRVDFIFSPYLIIDLHKKTIKNNIYLLLTSQFLILVIYSNDKPIYSNIHQFKIEDNNIEDNKIKKSIDNDDISSFDDDIGIIEDIDDIEDMDDIDNLDDSLDNIDDIDNMEIPKLNETEMKNDILNTKFELEILEFIKTSIKDYYNNYNSDFLENLYILKQDDEKYEKLIETLQDELLLKIVMEKIDILKDLNELAIKETE